MTPRIFKEGKKEQIYITNDIHRHIQIHFCSGLTPWCDLLLWQRCKSRSSVSIRDTTVVNGQQLLIPLLVPGNYILAPGLAF